MEEGGLLPGHFVSIMNYFHGYFQLFRCVTPPGTIIVWLLSVSVVRLMLCAGFVLECNKVKEFDLRGSWL